MVLGSLDRADLVEACLERGLGTNACKDEVIVGLPWGDASCMTEEPGAVLVWPLGRADYWK